MSRVLVTGCSKGIGRAVAQELARRGHEVVATARDVSSLEGLDVALTLPLDVQDEASVRAAAELAGDVDALVNNAGIAVRGAVESVPVAEAQRLLDVNVLGVLRTVRTFAPAFRARGGGAIVNVSSLAGRVTIPLAGVYTASKFALESLSEALRFELAPFGVRVVLVQPGMVATGAFEASPAYVEPEYAPLAGQLGALGADTVSPEDVARAVAAAVEDPAPPLRLPVGEAATRLLAARASLDDAAFDGAFRSAFSLTW